MLAVETKNNNLEDLIDDEQNEVLQKLFKEKKDDVMDVNMKLGNKIKKRRTTQEHC
jgi:hypothetical protein